MSGNVATFDVLTEAECNIEAVNKVRVLGDSSRYIQYLIIVYKFETGALHFAASSCKAVAVDWVIKRFSKELSTSSKDKVVCNTICILCW